MLERAGLPAWVLATVVTVAACGPGAPAGTTGGRESAPAQPSRTLRIVIRAEPGAVAGTILLATGISTGTQRRIFNAGLALKDGDGRWGPYLAEALPQLNTDSWKVLPDGRMETTYRLRRNLTWHDGSPLSAEDFVFAWRIYRTTELGIAGAIPHSLIEEVSGLDSTTVLIRWNKLYPLAGELDHQAFSPLPRGILGARFENERETFADLPFWSTEYVGAGPYRLERWERGAFIEGVAFDGHALGRPKIDRLRITWNQDFNVNLATLLGGEADMPGDDSIRVEQGLVLEREWNARGAGTVAYRAQLPRFVQVQHRAEYARPQAVRDVRVRRAFAHAIDKPVINETLFDGKGITTDSLLFPTLDYYGDIDRAVAKYPFDLRRTEQLMNEAGFAKDSAGSFVGPEGRLNFEVRNIQSAQNDAERSIIADGWRKAGFAMEEDVYSPVQTRDGQLLGTFRSLSITSAAASPEGLTLKDYTAEAISRPETRWIGQNRGGWHQPEYDRAINAWLTTLEPNQRKQLAVQAARILTEDLAVIPLHFNPGVIASAAGLRGFQVKTADSEISWNIYAWEFR